VVHASFGKQSQMHRGLKSAVFAVLLISAGYYFGVVCERIGQSYSLVLSPSKEVLELALRFFLAMGAVVITAGLVIALVRPLWACFLIFALSALAMLLGWELKMSSIVLAAVYFIASLLYASGIAKELDNRLRFSVGPIWHSQPILLTTLVVVACGSFYFGYASEIERVGFSIPSAIIEMFTDRIEEEVIKLLPVVEGEEAIAGFREQLEETLEQTAREAVEFLPEATREAAIATFRSQLKKALDEMEREAGERLEAADREHIIVKFREGLEQALVELVTSAIRPYLPWIPLVLTISLFALLLTITFLFSWVPILILMVIFPLLTALHVTREVTETRLVKRPTLG
jgi:uncharacterized membrane protein